MSNTPPAPKPRPRPPRHVAPATAISTTTAAPYRRSLDSVVVEDHDDTRRLLCIQTGGTIDKRYPKTQLGYNFEISDPAVDRIFERVRPSFDVEIETVCRKDSQDMSPVDHQAIIEAIQDSPCSSKLSSSAPEAR